MIAWLTDTLIYTGLLIGLVLVLRGPVARNFGAQTAYALWALPLLRFVMPPIVLPSSLAPEPAGEALAVYAVPAEPAADAAWSASEVPMAAASAGDAGWSLADTLSGLALPLWLAGAAVFLGWRTWTYLRMREDLLAGSRPVGEAGDVRLVETPAVNAPVAFGVFDKVIALPMEFMAIEDRGARDLAIEHELAHHRGRDLLANILAQPLLALHWFNPLAWIGWRAMRRDQEAACDARVIAHREPRERAIYGEVIASFAAGPRLALAAPMACPILGEKSIIHRLRSLNMSEISPRRRLAGRALLAGAALALPLTASISYAEAPAPPPPPDDWAPPAPPPAPDAPAAPDAPQAPAAPPAPDAPHFAWSSDDRDTSVEVREDADGNRTLIIRQRAEPGDAPADVRNGEIVHRFTFKADAPFDKEEFERRMEAVKEQMEGQRHAMAFGPDGKDFEFDFDFDPKDFEGLAGLRDMNFTVSTVAADCDGADGPVKQEFVTENGKRIHKVFICKGFAAAQARSAMAEAREALARAREQAGLSRAALARARASVARDRALLEETRKRVLRALDREIERLSEES